MVLVSVRMPITQNMDQHDGATQGNITDNAFIIGDIEDYGFGQRPVLFPAEAEICVQFVATLVGIGYLLLFIYLLMARAPLVTLQIRRARKELIDKLRVEEEESKLQEWRKWKWRSDATTGPA